jgi:uncharacterized protein
MKNLLDFLLNRLVDHPEDVRIEETEDNGFFTYTIHVHSDDMGRVIGKQGSVINAIRTLAKVRAVKDNQRVRIEVAEANPVADESVDEVEAIETETVEAADAE